MIKIGQWHSWSRFYHRFLMNNTNSNLYVYGYINICVCVHVQGHNESINRLIVPDDDTEMQTISSE